MKLTIVWRQFSKGAYCIQNLAILSTSKYIVCLKNFQAKLEVYSDLKLPDFFESKQLHLRAQIRQLLCAALVEKKDVNQNEWYMIRDNQQIHLVNQIPVCLISSSTIKVEYDEEGIWGLEKERVFIERKFRLTYYILSQCLC